MNQTNTISISLRQALTAMAISLVLTLLLSVAPANAQAESYSYTVQAGDGVTNLILDLAKSNDKEISVARAYKIAQDNGQKFLDNNLTVESDLPYTSGIGAFETAGVTIAASDNESLFDDLVAAINNSPDADSDNAEVPAEEESTADESEQTAADDSKNTEDKKDTSKTDESDEKSDDAEEDEGVVDEDSVWPWIIGIAAVLGGLYYINSSRSSDDS